jgi:hypothetical protein
MRAVGELAILQTKHPKTKHPFDILRKTGGHQTDWFHHIEETNESEISFQVLTATSNKMAVFWVHRIVW